MPHCIIEHSNNLESSSIVEAVHRGAQKSKIFDDKDIKTRAMGFEHYQSAANISGFIHVTTKILSGRNLQQRGELSQQILFELKQLNFISTSLTVEVVEMERESYAKIIT